jgi:rhodanese-related sulfurtransferase
VGQSRIILYVKEGIRLTVKNKVLIGILALALTAAVIVFLYNALNKKADGIENTTAPATDQPSTEATAEYRKISAEEAKEIIENNADAVVLDVRTEAEFTEQRVPGSVLLPDYEISDKAAEVLPDKDATILVYCRSGRRSENAARELANMGYMNVYDFGGIIDWPYDTDLN